MREKIKNIIFELDNTLEEVKGEYLKNAHSKNPDKEKENLISKEIDLIEEAVNTLEEIS